MNRICLTTLVALTVIAAVTSCEKPASGPQKLAVPVPVLANAGIDNATIMWEAVKNAESYEVIVDGVSTKTVTGVSITIDGLAPSTSYSLKMKAVAPKGSGDWKDSDYCEPFTFSTTGKTVLATPEITISDILSGGFTVSWKSVKNAAKYVYKVGDAAEQTTTETGFIVDGLRHSTEYTVKVKAVPADAMLKVAAESEWGEAKVTTLAPSTLAMPSLASSAVHTNGFTVSWTAVANAGKYTYKLDDGAEQSTEELSVVFTGLVALSDHTVKVKSVASDANAENYISSDWASISVKTSDLVALAAPVLESENVLPTEFTVIWTAVEHAARYMCSFNGGEFAPVTTNFVSYSGLHTETAYNVKVYAEPADGEKGTYKASPVSSINVTTKSGPSEDDKEGGLPDFDEKPIF